MKHLETLSLPELQELLTKEKNFIETACIQPDDIEGIEVYNQTLQKIEDIEYIINQKLDQYPPGMSESDLIHVGELPRKSESEEFTISYKQGGADLDTLIIANNKEEALSKFYNNLGDDADVWDVVCW